ncbi:unnamed protein product [Calypogeia fissa]
MTQVTNCTFLFGTRRGSFHLRHPELFSRGRGRRKIGDATAGKGSRLHSVRFGRPVCRRPLEPSAILVVPTRLDILCPLEGPPPPAPPQQWRALVSSPLGWKEESGW